MAIALLALALAVASSSKITSLSIPVPSEEPTPQELFAQVWINEVDTGLVVEFVRRGDDLSATGDDLRAIGLDAATGSVLVSLRSIAGLTVEIDQATQTVRMHVAAAGMHRMQVSAPLVQADDVRPAWGGLLNYSGYADNSGNAGATGELRFFGPAGTLSTGAFLRRGPGERALTVRRLETRYVLENPAAARRLTVGDFVSPDGSAEGALRVGGIQLTTDFSLQPDLVTAPVPHLSGGDGVPSTIDLYVDGVHRLSQNVQAGRFSVSGVPMVDGAGQISLLVRDVLGHESVQQLSFYQSRQLLKPHLTAMSAQVGLLRTEAFGTGERYGALFTSGAVRRGLSDGLTGEARAALAAPVQVTGGGVTAKLGEWAVASANGDFSHSAHGTGGEASLSLRRDDRHLSIFASARKSAGYFVTMADRDHALRGWRLQAGASWQVRRIGALSLSSTILREHSTRSRIFGASWSRPIGRRISAFVNVVETQAGRHELFGVAGLTMALSPRSSVSVQASRNGGGGAGSANWARAGDVDHGLDLRASISAAADRPALIGGATLRGTSGEIGGDIQLDRHGSSARAFASGAVIWLGEKPALIDRVGESFAVVQTGQPDVAVTLENRAAGRTGRDGNLFIPNLPAHAPARIALDLDGVDLDHDAIRTEMIVRSQASGGAIVHMPIRSIRAAMIHIVTSDGMPVRMGAVVLRPDGRRDTVGYDGVAYLAEVADNETADVQEGERHCRISFNRKSDDVVVCQPA